MSLLEALILGVLQGLTEFLPISSSGHLVLAQYFLGLREPQVFFDVMLHLGTVGAVLAVYRRDLGRLVAATFASLGNGDLYRRPGALVRGSEELRLLLLLVLGSIPTALIGFFFQEPLEAAFEHPSFAAAMLIVTGLLLQAPRLRPRRALRNLPVGWWHAPLVGVAQGLAILPGISRSGATISTALLLGVAPERAARFSFLLSIPAILGAVAVKLGDLEEVVLPPGVILAGTVAAFLVGWIALVFLLVVLRQGRFATFSYYCFALGGLALTLLLAG